MKRRQINAILVDQAKRSKKIAIYLCIIFSIFIIALVCFLLFINKNKTYYVAYTEDSKIDYKVYLKDNNFFNGEYLESNNQYIAGLIKNIIADFNYQLKVEKEDIEYKYQYKVEADVNVIDNDTNKSLYRSKEELVKEQVYYSDSETFVNINETIEIDYNYYNNLIEKFTNIYNLDEVTSTLTINLYVQTVGICEDLEGNNTSSVISLVIPLTTKTVAIDLEYDLVDSQAEKFMTCKKLDTKYYIYLICCVVLLFFNLIILLIFNKYVVMTRTAESIYDRELKKILNNYKSYIQKVNNVFDLEGYQVLRVDTFIEMLEIRDTIQEPILMVEITDEKGVYFLIPSKTKILYIYALEVSEIQKYMKLK